MKHVYVVESGEYEQRCIVGIFSTRELALAADGDDITVYCVDGDDITVPTWWWVTCNLHTLEWKAQTSNKAGNENRTPSVTTWPTSHNQYGYPDGRLDIHIFSSNADESIVNAKAAVLGQVVKVSSCTGLDVRNMWQPAGERRIDKVNP